MHRAPAVNFSVKRSRWHVRLVVCMVFLAVAALSAFASGQEFLDARVPLMAAALLVTSGVAFKGWKQSPQGTLRWDGQHWFWSDFTAIPVCRLRPILDFQRVVLVSVAAEAHVPVYLWLEAVPGDTDWRPLRRAIVSSQVGIDGAGKKTPSSTEGALA